MNTKVEKTVSKETPVKRIRTKAVAKPVSPIQTEMAKLESAYMSAISGEMKFGEVKSIFKQLHKEIKKSVKSKN